MSSYVSAAVRYMRLPTLVLLAVLMVKYGALFVAGRPPDSIVHILVEWVVPACSVCKTDREKGFKPPRQLQRLPSEATMNDVFKRKALAVQLCEFCDGDAIQGAMKAHASRTSQS